MMDDTRILKSDHVLHLIKCELVQGYLRCRNERIELTLKEAAAKFAPSSEPRARQNVLKARRGHYIGLKNTGQVYRNFLIINPTEDGDVRWLLHQNPELETSISEIYLVDEVTVFRNTTDLPSTNAFGATT